MFGCLHLLIRVSFLTLVSKTSILFHLLISKWHLTSRGVVSAFWSASDTDFKNLNVFWSVCLFPLIRVSPPLVIKWHWLQKPKFGCLTFWSGCLCLLIRMSLPFDQQVTLTSKTYFPTFTRGVRGCLHLLISKWHLTSREVVSAFWLGCLCLLISKFDQGDQGVSAFRSASDTDFKNLSLGVSAFW